MSYNDKNRSYYLGYTKIGSPYQRLTQKKFIPKAETILSPLPEDTVCLDCANYNLTKLENLPSSLEILLCNNNKLENLPILPNLNELDCSENSINWFNCDNLDSSKREIFKLMDSM